MNHPHSLFFAFLLVTPAFAQEPQTPQQEDVPRAVVSEVIPTEEGGLLFAIQLFASNKEILYLRGAEVKPQEGIPRAATNVTYMPFSLDGSTLTDVSTKIVHRNSPTLPETALVGPMEIYSSIRPGEGLEMGVAFPPLPPPREVDGKKQPYLLIFEIPHLKIRTPLKLHPETLQPL